VAKTGVIKVAEETGAFVSLPIQPESTPQAHMPLPKNHSTPSEPSIL